MQAPELVIVYGKPYSGKSTIASTLVRATSGTVVEHLSMGDRLRDISAGRVASALHSSLTANETKLKQHTAVPNEVVFDVFEEFLERPADLVVLDGFPRYADQLDSFRSKINILGTSLLAICRVEIPDDVVYARSQMRNRRFDDIEENREFVATRLAEYQHDTLPTLNTLSADYPCYQLDGEDHVAQNVTILQGIYRAHTLRNK